MRTNITQNKPKLKSDLLPVVRQMEVAKDAWLPKLLQTGELDGEALAQMVALRHSLHKVSPVHTLDTLLVVGAIRSVGTFIAHVLDNSEGVNSETATELKEGVLEILWLAHALRGKLEKDAGTTLEALGVFQDGVTLQ